MNKVFPLPLRAVLGLLAAYLLVALFYAHLQEEAKAIVKKDASSKETAEQEKQRLQATEERRHTELVNALRTQRSGTPGNSNVAQAKPTEAAAAAPPPTAETGSAMQSPDATPPTTAKKPPTTPSTRTLPDRLRAQFGWLLPVLALLGAALLGRFAWVGWRDQQVKLLLPDRSERDAPLLGLLLQAFAGPIGQMLPIPRQVKRLASKARLQHNLLHALAHSTAKAKPQPALALAFDGADHLLAAAHRATQLPPFPFHEAQQVLAFLLLLMIEQETAREDRTETSRPLRQTVPVRLRDLPEEEFATKLRALFTNWHRTGMHQPQYAEFERLAYSQKPPCKVPPYGSLQELSTTEESDRLLIQLYRLNTGLLG